MIRKIKKGIKVLLCFTFLFGIIHIYIILFNPDINKLPKGEYIESLVSPNGEYVLNAYKYSGGATMDWSLRVEVSNCLTHKKRNIYWNYHEQKANMKWIDEETVIINEKKNQYL